MDRVSSAASVERPGDEDQDPVLFAYLSENRGRAAVRGAFWAALNSLIPTLLTGLVFIVTSRYLLPSDFGLVALATSIVMFASGVGPTAFGEAIVQRQEVRKSHLDTVFWLAIACAATIYLALLLLTPLLSRLLGYPQIVPLTAIIALKLFFDLAAMVPNAIISRRMAFHLAALRTGIATIVSSVVALGLLVGGYGLWSIAFAQISATVASCVAAYWGARWLPGVRIRGASLRHLAHYGVFGSANGMLQTMNLDQLIIGAVISPHALGIYNFARRLLQMLNDVVAGGLMSVSHVLLSSLQDDRARVREAFLMATFSCSLASFPIFIGLASVSGEMIPLVFGAHWEPAVWPVRFFCVIGLMSGIGILQASLINSQGKAQWWFYYQLVRNAVTILTVLVFARWGVSKIVFALMAGVLLLWPITLHMVSRLLGIRIGFYLGQFVRPMLAALAMAAAVELTLVVLVGFDPWLRLLGAVAAGATIYAVTIWLLCRARILLLWQVARSRRGKSESLAASETLVGA